jgi:uncharacterized Zn-binding protein involved in type VI secretion
MPACSRKNGVDRISTNHSCTPITVTNEGSNNVFVNNIGAVRLGDKEKSHTVRKGKHCPLHALPLTKASSTVFVNNRGMGRVGDRYVSEVLISGSPNVFAGG